MPNAGRIEPSIDSDQGTAAIKAEASSNAIPNPDELAPSEAQKHEAE
jgi:hypothetical protein